MPDLFRVSSHGNSITVIRHKKKKFFRKVSYDSSGLWYLENERTGSSWYQQRTAIEKNLILSSFQNESYGKLDIRLLPGNSVDYSQSFSKTFNFVKKAIGHYVDVWPRTCIAPTHGDLTLSNILFDQEEVHFIDWEHFDSVGTEWGFDIIYLALSAAILPSTERNYEFVSDDIQCFKTIWHDFANLGISKEILNDPLSFLLASFNQSHIWKRVIKDSPKKLFPLCLTPDDIKRIQSQLIC